MLSRYKKDINRSLVEFLAEARDKYELSSPSGHLLDGIKNFVLRDGKRIRPLLFIAGFEGYVKNKKYSRKALLRSSLAFELLHDFLLIHDDVIDKADLRRGRPTLHKYLNNKLHVPASHDIAESLSIVAGDIIFALAIDALGSLKTTPAKAQRALARFLKATISTGTGEYIDVVNNITSLDRVSRKDVFRVYTLKTAEYTFEAPLFTGALLANAPEKELSGLSRFGLILGQAFQIQDDLLDLFGSSETTGKPVLSDLNESKKTLPVWKAYSRLSKKDKAELKRIFEKDRKTVADLKKVRFFIKDTGAGEYCLGITRSLLEEAEDILEGLKIKPACKKMIKGFVDNFFAKMELLSSVIGPPISRG